MQRKQLMTRLKCFVGGSQFISPLEFDEMFQENNKVYFRVQIKKFKCPNCPSFQTSRKFDLKRHISNVHEGKKTYPCNLCSLQFYGKKNLNRHVEIVHGYVLPKELKLLDTSEEINVQNASADGLIFVIGRELYPVEEYFTSPSILLMI